LPEGASPFGRVISDRHLPAIEYLSTGSRGSPWRRSFHTPPDGRGGVTIPYMHFGRLEPVQGLAGRLRRDERRDLKLPWGLFILGVLILICVTILASLD
jgi:hypothetical protein